MKLFLIGMPGSGKTYLGRQIALTLKIKFIDLDSIIENDEKVSIKQLIQEKGEAYFRQKENLELKKVGIENNVIVSCGGGVPMYFDNLEFMKKEGIVIWLNTKLSLISSRIKQNRTRRPMFIDLTDSEIDQKIFNLFNQREKFYKKADIVYSFNGDKKNMLSAVIQRIIIFSRHKKC